MELLLRRPKKRSIIRWLFLFFFRGAVSLTHASAPTDPPLSHLQRIDSLHAEDGLPLKTEKRAGGTEIKETRKGDQEKKKSERAFRSSDLSLFSFSPCFFLLIFSTSSLSPHAPLSELQRLDLLGNDCSSQNNRNLPPNVEKKRRANPRENGVKKSHGCSVSTSPAADDLFFLPLPRSLSPTLALPFLDFLFFCSFFFLHSR